MTSEELRVALAAVLTLFLAKNKFSEDAKVELVIRLVNILSGVLVSSAHSEVHLQEGVDFISGQLRDCAAGAFADLSRLLAVARESRSERSVH